MIQIIDYGAGNIKSVINALEKIGQKYQVIGEPQKLHSDSKVIFPGVGAAGAAMKSLQKSGFDKAIPKLKNPFLGICLGMQLLLEYSEEDSTDCIGIISGQVKKFKGDIKVPQIGWNTVDFMQDDELLADIKDNSYFYFVNSYYANSAPINDKFGLAKTTYGSNFISMIKKNNFRGVQFHPEKSGKTGLKLLSNFCELCS